MTEPLLADDYLRLDDRPDTAYPECERLRLLSEWLEVVRDGYSDISGYLFESPHAAERYFADVARTLAGGNVDR